ncbi:GNAT family N-acetyltransferase [Jiella sp. M17.18]|uniref:GNAT family N-acetyltransferase n=1 Tax=Jiella sp. M17.18 TaxID=3234247 RepID=UPI0034DFCF86
MDGLLTPRLMLRRWREADRDVFHRLNSDDVVMRFFPMRRTRLESDAMMDLVEDRYAREGIGFLALQELSTGAVVGMLGAGRLGDHHPFAGAVELGWRLLPEYWGRGYATEGALASAAACFETLGVQEVVAQCVVTNEASQAVMRRIGMTPAETFAHPDVDPDRFPELVEHRLFRLSRADWQAQRSASSAG